MSKLCERVVSRWGLGDILDLKFSICSVLESSPRQSAFSFLLSVFNCSVASFSFLPDGPIITEGELTSLPLVKVVPDGQYTGPKLNTVVRMMRGLLEQKVPLQEFEVRLFF